MNLEQRLAKLESDNRQLKFIAGGVILALSVLLMLKFGGSASPLQAQGAKQPPPKADELRVTKLIMVDSKGKDRVTLTPDESAGTPNAPVFSVLDMNGKRIARIGATDDAGPAIQFYVDGNRTASYSHMNLSLRAPKSNVDRLYLGLPRAGEVVSSLLEFHSKTGKKSLALEAKDNKGGSIRLFGNDGDLAFEKP